MLIACVPLAGREVDDIEQVFVTWQEGDLVWRCW